MITYDKSGISDHEKPAHRFTKIDIQHFTPSRILSLKPPFFLSLHLLFALSSFFLRYSPHFSHSVRASLISPAFVHFLFPLSTPSYIKDSVDAHQTCESMLRQYLPTITSLPCQDRTALPGETKHTHKPFTVTRGSTAEIDYVLPRILSKKSYNYLSSGIFEFDCVNVNTRKERRERKLMLQ